MVVEPAELEALTATRRYFPNKFVRLAIGLNDAEVPLVAISVQSDGKAAEDVDLLEVHAYH